MKTLILLITLLSTLVAGTLDAQRYVTRNGVLQMRYKAPHGLMETVNRQVHVGLDVETGEFQLRIVMLSFRYDGGFHQEQHNEYFKENTHFSNSTFRGWIENMDEIDFNTNGTYKVKVSGDLTLRMVTNQVATTGDFIVKDDQFSGNAVFKVSLLDFGVNLPSSMEEFIEVRLDADLRRL